MSAFRWACCWPGRPFLGAAIFNVVGGVAFVPCRTLWIQLTTKGLPRANRDSGYESKRKAS